MMLLRAFLRFEETNLFLKLGKLLVQVQLVLRVLSD